MNKRKPSVTVPTPEERREITAKMPHQTLKESMAQTDRARATRERELLSLGGSKDESYALAGHEEIYRRGEMIIFGHIKPLLPLLNEIRNYFEFTPNFDPCDGGIDAKVLFLLEAPGRKAQQSSFISRNNPDPTAKNMNELLSPLRREDTILWNIVPWYIGSENAIRPAARTDISAARQFLSRLIGSLKHLQFIVLMGNPARSERIVIERLLSKAKRKVEIRETSHPGQRVFNCYPHKRNEIEAVINEIGCTVGFKTNSPEV